MKKIDRDNRIKFENIHLYREDLEEITKAIQNCCKRTEIQVDDNVFEEGDSFGDIRTDVSNVKIRGHSPYVHFDIDKYGVSITYDSDTPASVIDGIQERLKCIAEKRTCKLLKFLSWVIGLSLSVPVFYMGISSFANDGAKSGIPYFLFTLFFILVYAFIETKLFAELEKSRVFLTYKNENPTFFKRNKDALIVGSIVAVVGTVFGTIIIDQLKSAYSDKPKPEITEETEK